MDHFISHYNGIVINLIVMLLCVFSGSKLKKVMHVTEDIENALFTGIGLACILVGVSGVHVENPIACVASLLIGPIIGTKLRLVDRVQHLIDCFAGRLFGYEDSKDFREPFISYLMLTLIGTLSVNGPLENIVHGDVSLMLIKSCLDGLVAFVFAMSYREYKSLYMAVPIVFLFECLVSVAITFASSSDVLLHSLDNTSTVGSIIMIMVGLNVINVSKIETLTLVPAIFVPMLFSL